VVLHSIKHWKPTVCLLEKSKPNLFAGCRAPNHA